MADLLDHLAEGYQAIVDEVPAELSRDAKGAWAIGYLYALANWPCPTAIRVIRDNVVGTYFEVDDTEKKSAYVVFGREGRLLPVKIYER